MDYPLAIATTLLMSWLLTGLASWYAASAGLIDHPGERHSHAQPTPRGGGAGLVLALVFVTVGYNTRFYRALFVEEYGKDHIRTARAFGAPERLILWKHVLKNSMVPIVTRIMFSIPLVVISGSLLIESYFGIPGIGQATFEAITSGDQPVLKAVVGLTAVVFVLIQTATELLYRLLDPRVAR